MFDPDEPAGKDHLVELGVDTTIAGDAAVAEFVVTLRELDLAASPYEARSSSVATASVSVDGPRATLLVVSGPRGSGITEIAAAGDR